MNSISDLCHHYAIAAPELLDTISGPTTLINYFALRDEALYPDSTTAPCSGLDAMLRYAAISGERLASVGGEFLVQGLPTGTLWGNDESWDLVVVANYPDASALRSLLEDPQYQAAFIHRRAAVARERVTVATTLA